MARECTQAWNPVSPVDLSADPVDECAPDSATITDEPPVDLESDTVPINVDNPLDPVETLEKRPATITDEPPVDLESDPVPIHVDNLPDPVVPPEKPPVKAASQDVSMTTNPVEPPEKPPLKLRINLLLLKLRVKMCL